MKDFDKISMVQSDILDVLYIYTGMLTKSDSVEDDAEYLEMIDKLTTNLKRVGDTALFDGENDGQVGKMIEEEDGDNIE